MKFSKKKVKFTYDTKKNDGCSLLYLVVEKLVYDKIEHDDLDPDFINEIILKMARKKTNKINISKIKKNLRKEINNLIKKVKLAKNVYVPVLNKCEGNKKYCVNNDDLYHLKDLLKMIS